MYVSMYAASSGLLVDSFPVQANLSKAMVKLLLQEKNVLFHKMMSPDDINQSIQ